MAVKTAESDALKRAAINLGTQFGLSLYDNGSRADVVGHTLAAPDGYEMPVVENVERLSDSAVADLAAAVRAADSEDALRVVWDTAAGSDSLDSLVDGDTLRVLIVDRLAEIRGVE